MPAPSQATLFDQLQEPVPYAIERGTHRSSSFESTLARAEGLAPVMGITRVANVTGLDSVGIPVVMVVRPNSKSLSVAQGKGLTLAAAKASGLMESVEGYHAENVAAPLRICSYEELRYDAESVDPTDLPLASLSRYDPNVPMTWCAGIDLRQGMETWVPYDLVHTDLALPWIPGSGCFSRSSNGLASGNHPLEAVSHGICEVVERDATTLWALSSREYQEQSLLDLASVDDPDCQQVLAAFHQAGLRVTVWDTTSDIGIASFECAIEERDRGSYTRTRPAGGHGCHPSRAIALLRALTEAAQSRLTQIAGSRDDLRPEDYEGIRDSARSPTASTADRDGRAPRSFPEIPNYVGASLNDDVTWEIDRLQRAGLERVLVVDLTKAAFGIPVVRVLVPGLEGVHSKPGYLPGPRARARLRRSP